MQQTLEKHQFYLDQYCQKHQSFQSHNKVQYTIEKPLGVGSIGFTLKVSGNKHYVAKFVIVVQQKTSSELMELMKLSKNPKSIYASHILDFASEQLENAEETINFAVFIQEYFIGGNVLQFSTIILRTYFSELYDIQNNSKQQRQIELYCAEIFKTVKYVAQSIQDIHKTTLIKNFKAENLMMGKTFSDCTIGRTTRIVDYLNSQVCDFQSSKFYSHPTQINDSKVVHDYYALGVIIYILLEFRLPWEDPELGQQFTNELRSGKISQLKYREKYETLCNDPYRLNKPLEFQFMIYQRCDCGAFLQRVVLELLNPQKSTKAFNDILNQSYDDIQKGK